MSFASYGILTHRFRPPPEPATLGSQPPGSDQGLDSPLTQGLVF
ncbi:hypothetical protein [Trichothermofontia sp.]